jgi:Ca2+-transporting ATPase
MFLAPIFGISLPLLPVQILWMNLVTDGLPALALGVESGETGVMQRPPRDPTAPIIDRRMGIHILWVGLLMAVVSLAVGVSAFPEGGATGAVGGAIEAAAGHGHVPEHASAEPSVWQTMLFTTMVWTQLFLALAVRSSRQSVFKKGLFSNRALVAALAVTFVLQLGVVYLGPMQAFFRTAALSASQLAITVAAGTSLFVAVELEKYLRRRFARRRGTPA